MSLKIVRNDLTKMKCDAIVNTASPDPIVGRGCDMAVYQAAGYNELLNYRVGHIGSVTEGEVFWTPAFKLEVKYIIHAVSPSYMDGRHGEVELLRSCYRKSMEMAADLGLESLAFPLIATGSLKYPVEEGMRIAMDEINAFLLRHDMLIYLVLFDNRATQLGEKLYPSLEEYIDREYVDARIAEEIPVEIMCDAMECCKAMDYCMAPDSFEEYDRELKLKGTKIGQRMLHMTDTFVDYLMYLIEEKKLSNADVYKGGLVDKRLFSKLKADPDYHPTKQTALCLCIGAHLNLDESKDLLARAGYAFSPCSKTDIIFSYYIENGIYDISDLDCMLGEYGEPQIIN